MWAPQPVRSLPLLLIAPLTWFFDYYYWADVKPHPNNYNWLSYSIDKYMYLSKKLGNYATTLGKISGGNPFQPDANQNRKTLTKHVHRHTISPIDHAPATQLTTPVYMCAHLSKVVQRACGPTSHICCLPGHMCLYTSVKPRQSIAITSLVDFARAP